MEWYIDIDPQLAIKFLDEYRIASTKIANNPTHYSFIAPHARRITFEKIRAMLVYKINENIIEVIAIKDMSSRPDKQFY